MNTRRLSSVIALAVVAALVLAAGGFALYRLGQQHGASSNVTTAAALKAGDIDPATGRKVLYWHDPMVPGQRFDRPGRSPFMDMDLVPVYADDGADAGGVSISPRVQQNLGVRLATVVRGELAPQMRVAGSVVWNEREQVVVQARAGGFVEKLHVRATLDRVARGQPIAELYVPEWVAAQEDYLTVRRMAGGQEALLDASRARLRQLGMSDAQIAEFERSGRVQARSTLVAPQAGVMLELAVREGMTVMAGSTLARINATGTVWVNAEVPESQAAQLRVGTPVRATLPGAGEEVFHGRVQAILPDVATDTRTLKARVELANPGGRLAPGMYVNLALGARPVQALLVPSEALIHTGTRTVVMRADSGAASGKGFTPVDVVAGIETNGQTEIRSGLAEGDRVVVSGQFLLDSEASLRASGTRLAPAPASSAPAASSPAVSGATEYTTDAVFESREGDTIMLSHPPIAALGWGAMTMGFAAPKAGLPAGLKAGQKLRVGFVLPPGGAPTLTRVEPLHVTAAPASDPHAGHRH